MGSRASTLCSPVARSALSQQSPAAYTSGRVVRPVSSVTIPFPTWPPAACTRATLGRTPTAATRMSKSRVPPLFRKARPCSKRTAVSPRRSAVPAAPGGPAPGGRRSRLKCWTAPGGPDRRPPPTFTPLCDALAHFRPISPAPRINTRLSGVRAASNAWASSRERKVNFRSTSSAPGSPAQRVRNPWLPAACRRGSLPRWRKPPCVPGGGWP